MDQRSSSKDVQPRAPSLTTRVLYALAGAFSLFPTLLAVANAWIGLGSGGMGINESLLLNGESHLLFSVAILFRIYQVLRYPRALEAWPVALAAKRLRGVAVFVLFVGALATVVLLLIGAISYAFMPNLGGYVFILFIVTTYLMLIANVGWMGCLFYEMTRMAGRPPKAMRPPSPYRWKQDVSVAAVLVASCIGVPILWQASMPPLCQDNRIACVSATQTDVKRMVALPLDTTVHFESSVKSIDLQRHSGKRIKWSLRENPAVSLEASGYPPTTDPNATVRVKIDAQETQNGVVMHVLVSEGPLQTARFTTTFGHGSKLERDERGAVHVAIEAPSNIDTMIRGSYKDESNEPYMIDQIYALLRQAIGTEQEARESAVRLVRTARITSRVEGDVGGVSAKARWDGALIEPRCEQFMTVNFNGPVHSGSVGELGFRLSEVRFTRSPDTPPHTNIHSSEHVICEDGGVLILGYGGTGTNPLFSYRKYSADGKLRRYVQSPLPPRKEDWDFIDLGTVRESATAITFDLVSMQLTKRKDRFVKRESFEIPL